MQQLIESVSALSSEKRKALAILLSQNDRMQIILELF